MRRSSAKSQAESTKDDDVDKGIIEEFSDETTLHGVRHAIDESWPRRIIWSILVLTSFILLIIQVTAQFKQYSRNPIVANVELEYKSEMNFPAVVICNTNQFKITSTKDNLYSLITEIYKTGKPDTETIDFMNYTNEFKNVEGTALNYMKQVESTIEDMLLKCLWPNGTACHASDFDKFPTDYGVCYGINTHKHKPAKVTAAGVKHGIYLLINVEAYERTGGPMTTQGLKVLIYNQTDLPLVSFRIRPCTWTFLTDRNKCFTAFCSIKEHFSCAIKANEEITDKNCLENCTTIRYRPQISASRLGTDSLAEMIGKQKTQEMKERYINATNSRYRVQEDLVEKMDKHIENARKLQSMLKEFHFEPVRERFKGFWESIYTKVPCAKSIEIKPMKYLRRAVDQLGKVDEDAPQKRLSFPLKYRLVYENNLEELKNGYEIVNGTTWFEKWTIKRAEKLAKDELKLLRKEMEDKNNDGSLDMNLPNINRTYSNYSLEELMAKYMNITATPLEMIFIIYKHYLGYCVDAADDCAHNSKPICKDKETAQLETGGETINRTETESGKTCIPWSETYYAYEEYGNHSMCRGHPYFPQYYDGPGCYHGVYKRWEKCFKTCDFPKFDEWVNVSMESEITRQMKSNMLLVGPLLVSLKKEALENLNHLIRLLDQVANTYDNEELSKSAEGYDHFFRMIDEYETNTLTNDELAHGSELYRESITNRLTETVKNLQRNVRHFRKYDFEKTNLSQLLTTLNSTWQNNSTIIREVFTLDDDRDVECEERIEHLTSDVFRYYEKRDWLRACPIGRNITDDPLKILTDTAKCVAEIKNIVDEMESKLDEIEKHISNEFKHFIDHMTNYIENMESADYFYQNNILAVNIYYQELSVEKFVQHKAYSIFSLFSDIGGTLGLFLGASILTIFEMIDFFIIKPLLMRYKMKRMASRTISHSSNVVNPYEVDQKQIEPPSVALY